MDETGQKILFIDFDGTITKDQYWRSLSLEIHNKLQALLFSGERQMVHDWMRGKYSAEEVNRYVSDQLSIDYQNLWDLFVKDCKTIVVPDAILNQIQSLREKYLVVLITGNMDSFSRFTVPALNLDQYFEYIVNSFDEKKHKTDNNGEQFVEWADRLDASLSESILIDDQEKVCNIFSQLGGQARQTKSLIDTQCILNNL
tara:strand:+ start:99 stop:698 length:600 start_codon:yes stop_codon:yes gene_type:complete